MERRAFIRKAVGLTGLLFLQSSRAHSLLQWKDSIKESTKTPKVISVKDILGAYNALPENKKRETINHLENYSEKMPIVKIAKDINNIVKLPIKNYKNKGVNNKEYLQYAEYNPFNKELCIYPFSDLLNIECFLSGNNLKIIGEAHEKIHFLQDKSNKWYDFESFIYNYPAKKNLENLTKLELLNNTEIEKFRELILKDNGISPEKVQSLYWAFLNEFVSTKNKRGLLNEVQTSIMFEGYITNKEKLKEFFRDSPLYSQFLNSVSEKEFDMAWDSIMTLFGASIAENNYLSAPKNLGTWDGNIEGLYKKLHEITSKQNISKRMDLGYKFKEKMHVEAQRLTSETAKTIRNAYLKSTKEK